MARQQHTPEQIIAKLREAEVALDLIILKEVAKGNT